MNKTTEVLLAMAIVCLVVGFALNAGLISTGGIDALYVVLPMGAVFAGLFLIVKVLEKESTLHDEEQRAPKTGTAKSVASIAEPEGSAAVEHQSAHS